VTTSLSQLLERHLGRKRLELIRIVADKAFALGYSSYLAGGAVRDILLKQPLADLDIVVEGDAIGLARALARSLGGKVTAHQSFLTATWERPALTPELSTVDLATARSELYAEPAALPTVRPAAIEVDLRRRDFTINAMAIRLDIDRWGELIDPHGGEGDVRGHQIRGLHKESFIEDPTRMYRAVRYEKRLDFSISDETLALVAGALQAVEALSGERIRHELDRVIDEPRFRDMLARLQELDLLPVVHRALRWDESAIERLGRAPSRDELGLEDFSERNLRWLLWLAGAGPTDLEEIAARLSFDGALALQLRVVTQLRAELDELGALRPSELTARLDGLPPLAVYAVALLCSDARVKGALLQYLREWRKMGPTITGNDLKAAGLPPGPKFARILSRLRAAWIDGEISSRADEARLLEDMISGGFQAEGNSAGRKPRSRQA